MIKLHKKFRGKQLFLFPFLALFIFASCQKKDGTPTVPISPPVDDSSGTNPGDSSGENTPEYVTKITNADWDSTWVSDAVLWKYYQFTDLFNAMESVTVFEVNLNDDDLVIKFPYVTTGSFLKTSEGAANVGAVAAINGSYFYTDKGGSEVFFRLHGDIITYKRQGYPQYRTNVGLAISQTGDVSIIKRPTSGWESTSTYDLLTAGPLLVYDDKIMDQLNKTFNTGRNPRTAVGLTDDNRLIAVVVDGRASMSSGMKSKEMAKVMKALGCKVAMNFDGGGSSTAWVKDKGVVNYPSDNKKFDHGGERAVATVIAFVMKK